MTRRNVRMQDEVTRCAKWRGSNEFIHAEPRQTIGNTHLVLKTRQSGITK